MSKLRYEFETPDFYGVEDIESLKAAFGEVLSREFDENDETIEAATCVIVPEDSDGTSVEISDEQKKEIVDEFLAKATITATVNVTDGKTVFETDLSVR
jgi:pyruvoyl-dependent arginine decarboxylase (PvlArgDC)